MQILQRFSQVYQDERQTKPVQVISFELSGLALPKEKNVPIMIWISWCRPIFLMCSHQGADVFLAFPIAPRAFLRLRWKRICRRII